MVVETFVDGDPKPVYRHLAEQGRGLPDGLRYLESWVDASLGRCFQLMESEDPTLFEEWMRHWAGLVEFEVVPVVSSAEARALVEP
jgi:hypothetical protein